MVNYVGDAGANTHPGTQFKDTLDGQGGNDTLSGQASNDSILGGDGADRLDGGAGKDTLLGGLDNDSLFDGWDLDADRLEGGDGADYVLGGAKDHLLGGADNDNFELRFDYSGPVSADLGALTAGGSITFARTTLSGFENGSLYLSPGDDKIVCARMELRYYGMDGGDTLVGGALDDTLDGGLGPADGADVLRGNDGDDRITGGPGDKMHGGAGTDTFQLEFRESAFSYDVDFTPVATGGAVLLGDGSVLTGCEAGYSYWGTGNDRIRTGSQVFGDGVDVYGGGGADTLIGGDGFDSLDGGLGNDVIRGGGGTDEMSFLSAQQGVALNLNLPDFQDTGGSGMDKVSGVEDLSGTFFNDRFVGDGQANRLAGFGGSDTLIGGVGDDTLLGGAGFNNGDTEADRLAGGAGQDVYCGGGGADLLIWTSVAHTVFGAADSIALLEAQDIIDLEAIDADVNTAGDQAFTISATLTGVAGQLAILESGGTTHFYMDVDGDSFADGHITAEGDHTGHTAFVL